MSWFGHVWNQIEEGAKAVGNGISNTVDDIRDLFKKAIQIGEETLDKLFVSIAEGIGIGLTFLAIGVGSTAAVIIAAIAAVYILTHWEEIKMEETAKNAADSEIGAAEDYQNTLEQFQDAITKGITKGISDLNVNVAVKNEVNVSDLAKEINKTQQALADNIAEQNTKLDELNWNTQTNIAQPIQDMSTNLSWHMDQMKNDVAGGLAQASALTSKALDDVGVTIADRITSDGSSLGEKISGLATKVGQSIDGLAGKISEKTKGVFSGIENWAEKQLTRALTSWFDVVKDFFFEKVK